MEVPVWHVPFWPKATYRRTARLGSILAVDAAGLVCSMRGSLLAERDHMNKILVCLTGLLATASLAGSASAIDLTAVTLFGGNDRGWENLAEPFSFTYAGKPAQEVLKRFRRISLPFILPSAPEQTYNGHRRSHAVDWKPIDLLPRSGSVQLVSIPTDSGPRSVTLCAVGIKTFALCSLILKTASEDI